MERKTPLYQTHVDAGGKIVEFGGFLMPVQYPTGVLAEHMAVRQKAGLFDVSHMGELRLKGPKRAEAHHRGYLHHAGRRHQVRHVLQRRGRHP